MSAHTILALVFFSVLMSTICADSLVTLVSDPSNIYPVLTKSHQVRCAIQNNKWFPPLQTTSLYEWLTTPRPSSTVHPLSRSDNIAKLLSVVITKVNQEIGVNETLASVTSCSVPVIEENFRSKFQAEGSTEGSNQEGEVGYLVLTWDIPNSGHAGNFTCEAYALNSDKHPISLSVDLEVTAVEPSIADLATYISTNEREVESLKSTINTVADDNAALRRENNQLLSKAAELEERFSEIKGQNIQSGSFSCYNQLIPFSQPYNDTPLVFFAPSSESISSSSYSYVVSASYSLNIQEVTQFNFTISCYQSYYSTAFSWLAIDN